eukprot:TRINITY_DN4837_c0_g2_i1.p1 TRINITY_DN4837_c0_g2~~TRINITY_DN4837_c0_g2_i1.p1  ORF type:complete len:205 (-),score=28.96 TRINITY_DN4837_c0_g2_i1:401-1015(-)
MYGAPAMPQGLGGWGQPFAGAPYGAPAYGAGMGMQPGAAAAAAQPAAQSPAAKGPSQPLTMIAPANAFSGEAGSYTWCRVAYAGGVDLRTGPSVQAPKTGETLCQNATFAAAEEIMGQDSRMYLRLADGRGWAFDDSAIFPHDPSVRRGFWQPIGPAPADGSQAPAGAGSPAAAGAPGQHPGLAATSAAGGLGGCFGVGMDLSC